MKLGGSLAAILALAWTARKMGLGGEARLEDEQAARAAIEAAAPGFSPAEIALDKSGRGALARDASARILLLRPHGAHFAARLLSPRASAQLDGPDLLVESGDRRFGPARLALADPTPWMKAIADLGLAHHA